MKLTDEMKRMMKTAAAVVVVFLLVYCAMAFVLLSPNPAAWSEEARVFYLAASAGVSIPAGVVAGVLDA